MATFQQARLRSVVALKTFQSQWNIAVAEYNALPSQDALLNTGETDYDFWMEAEQQLDRLAAQLILLQEKIEDCRQIIGQITGEPKTIFQSNSEGIPLLENALPGSVEHRLYTRSRPLPRPKEIERRARELKRDKTPENAAYNEAVLSYLLGILEALKQIKGQV